MSRTIRPTMLATAIGQVLAARQFLANMTAPVVEQMTQRLTIRKSASGEIVTDITVTEAQAAESIGRVDVEEIETRAHAAGFAPPIETSPETQVCKSCYHVFMRDVSTCPECGAPGMKPKRIRSRHKPLTAADIVEGGVYVPKRGNDKTPNFVVTLVSPRYDAVNARKVDQSEGCVRGYSTDEFLALVSRRVA